MTKFNRLICMGILGVSLSGAAMANSYEATPYRWGPERPSLPEYKDYHPYLENGKETQNQQWANEDWYVQDWVSQRPGDMALIDGFFKSDIIRSQTVDRGVPTLVVGSNFYRLGGFDKRRIITTIDAVYGITESGPRNVILLKDWKTNAQIGVFTKDGLQIE